MCVCDSNFEKLAFYRCETLMYKSRLTQNQLNHFQNRFGAVSVNDSLTIERGFDNFGTDIKIEKKNVKIVKNKQWYEGKRI